MKNQQKVITKSVTALSPYDALSITDIESKIRELSTLSRESMREMYVVLEYLRISGRYKENPGYKKATFWQYLEDIFTIREGTYRENSRAYLKFPEEAVRYGVGIVAKIDRISGGRNVKKVVDEIAKSEASHKKPLSRSAIEVIIQKNRTTPLIQKVNTNWEAMYKAEKAAHLHTINELKIAVAKVKELQGQIEKLKVTAEKVTSIRTLLDGKETGAMQARMM